MLVLSRKDGEEIRIGDNVVITLVRGMNGKARIGVSAPKSVPVVRAEIDDREPSQQSESEPCPLGDKCPCLAKPNSKAG
jgi:carbon storage regulator